MPEVDAGRGDGTYEDVYKTELEYTLSDDPELIIWARNNMNWADLKHRVTQLPTDPLLSDYDQEWSNADMEVER